jgi:hypothetical protein
MSYEGARHGTNIIVQPYHFPTTPKKKVVSHAGLLGMGGGEELNQGLEMKKWGGGR